MRMSLLIPLLAVLGCESTQCKIGDVASVTVSVFDASGAPLSPDALTYAVDGEDGGDCEPLDAGSTEFTCGLEEPGSFVVTAEVDGYYFSGAVEVELAADECHVVGEFIEITAG